MKKIKVLFLIHTMGAGGAERALVNLVNNLNNSKFDITIETMFDDGINLERLQPHINYISKKAPSPKGISIILKFIPAKALYNYFIGSAKYDLMIAFMHGAPVKVIAGNKHAKKIAWLHNGNPETSTMFENWIKEKNSIKDYKDYNRIVGVCESVSNAFERYTGINDIKTIYNTLDTKGIKTQAATPNSVEFDKSCINLVSTGRLAKEKGYVRLVNICKLLKDDGYKFRLYLIGTGAEFNILNNAIKKNELEDEVILLGFQENPYTYVNQCDVFVCSSFTEGLSTATIEAVILGKAVVSTDVSGAREILEDGKCGLIVENSEEGIYNGLKELLSNPEKIEHYKEKALERAQFFDTKNTVNSVEKLIEEVINE